MRVAFTALCALALLPLAGCASAPKSGPKAKVSHIEVSYIEKLESRIEDLDAQDRVRASIGAALRRVGLHSQAGSLELLVNVISFRLRGAETTRWLGSMAGFDKLGVDVRVLRGDEVVETFRVKFGLAGGSSGAPRTSRLSKLMVNLGDRVAEKMQRLDIRDPVPRFADEPGG